MEAPFIRIKAIALMISWLTLTYLNFKQWSAYDNGLLHTTQELNLKNKILLNLRMQTDTFCFRFNFHVMDIFWSLVQFMLTRS